MALRKKKVAAGVALSLPAVAAMIFVGMNSFDSAKADIGPIPLPPIPLLGGSSGATPTGSPSPSTSAHPSASPSASARPSASPSVSPSGLPSPSPSPTAVAAPKLTQSNENQNITFTLRTSSQFKGMTAYFYRRSGMTGKVAPLGTGTVDNAGFAFRFLKVRPKQIIRAYAKLPGSSPPAVSAYSNDVSVKVP